MSHVIVAPSLPMPLALAPALAPALPRALPLPLTRCSRRAPRWRRCSISGAPTRTRRQCGGTWPSSHRTASRAWCCTWARPWDCCHFSRRRQSSTSALPPALGVAGRGSCAPSGRSWRLGQLGTPRRVEGPAHWAPSHCLGCCSSEPPSKPLIPLPLGIQAGANRVYACEPHGFLAQLAQAQLQRHALLCFERDNWSRMPMSLVLAERCRQAGGAAFR